MKTVAEYVKAQRDISLRIYGHQRSDHAAVHELQSRLRTVQEDPTSLYGWVDIILAGLEGGLRSGASAYALAQALINRQNELAAKRVPPTLAGAS
ncbi:MAG TPA: dATP/dGTP pyrophosphohydrolase domain-containing protein [Myxococcota bacterium]|nr:dATP/dGTP pyrophosphohydrolase domain-containing protein [Myxococcota bacterium]